MMVKFCQGYRQLQTQKVVAVSAGKWYDGGVLMPGPGFVLIGLNA